MQVLKTSHSYALLKTSHSHDTFSSELAYENIYTCCSLHLLLLDVWHMKQQCVAVCYSALQYVAVCYIVLQCVAVSRLQCLARQLDVWHIKERWGAGVETQKNVLGVFGGWGRVPFNEPHAPSSSTIYDGA